MPHQLSDRKSPFMSAMPVVLVASILLICIAIINPFREMLSQDDAWIYARMVRHMLATGKYQLDTAAAANLPVQIYLAAGLSKIFGYSLVLLRLTTLGLFVTALICLYCLLREFGHSPAVASVFTLAVIANAIILTLSFAFMSDIQFLGWLALAQLLYVRGIRRQSAWLLFLGSVAAGCAIGTRQFGIVLIIGLFATWLAKTRSARLGLGLLIAALAVPCAAAAFQMYSGMKTPNLLQYWTLEQTRTYLSSPLLVIAHEIFWRLSIITQYLAICLLPLLPLSLFISRRFWRERLGPVPLWLLSILGCAAIVLALWMNSPVLQRPGSNYGGPWEPLQLEFLLPMQFGNFPFLMRLLDLAGIVAAAPLICMFLYGLKLARSLRGFRPEAIFLIASSLGLLALHLIYGQLHDPYTVPMFFYVLLLMAALLNKAPLTQLQVRISAVSCIVAILALSLWIRAQYEFQGAFWKAADTLQRQGVPPADIAVTLHWQLYNGLFDTWIAAGHPGTLEDWYQSQRRQAHYLVGLAYQPEAIEGWQLLTSYKYRNLYFAKRYVTVLKR